MAYQNGKTYYIIPLCATGDAAYNQKILNKQVQPLSLNTRGTGNHYNNRNVNVYSLDWSTDMQWKVMVYDGFARILCAGDTSYGLDYYYGSSNPGNCDIYKINGNDEDSKINFRTINASENLYRIQCYRNNADNDLYLTATGTSNGADVRWQPLDSSKAAYQTWWLVPVENVSENTTPTPTVPNTPDEIENQEFFVKAYGTNLYLNVHGSDTVADTRNVNVYTKENCDAQKWIAKQKTAGPKLFTSIDQTFALNIDTANNNCTMYTASDNDNDSVLDFEEMGDMLYRIKMHNHNKYLHVDTDAESGDNVYWVSDINSANYWEFIPESVVFPDSGQTPEYALSDEQKNAFREFLENMQDFFEFSDSFIEEAVLIGKKKKDFGTKTFGWVSLTSSAEVEATKKITDGYIANITIDPTDLKNPTISFGNKVFEIYPTVENLNLDNSLDVEKLKDIIYNMGVSLNGGNFAFKTSVKDSLHGEFDIVYNTEIVPENPDAGFDVSITIHIDVDFDEESAVKFLKKVLSEIDEFFVIVVPIIIYAMIIYGEVAILTTVFKSLASLFPLTGALGLS